MPLMLSTSGGGDFKSVPQGSHGAICNMVVDLGVQPGSQMYPDPKRQILIRFEVPEERIEWTDKDGVKREGPIVIQKTYTASMGDKANLRKDLESWRGRTFSDLEAANFDVSTILGKPAMLLVTVTEKGGKSYSNIKSIGGVPKGMIVGKIPGQAENPLLYYADDDKSKFDQLPEWVRKKIENQIRPQTQREYQRDNDGVPLEVYGQFDPSQFDKDEDPIPF